MPYVSCVLCMVCVMYSWVLCSCVDVRIVGVVCCVVVYLCSCVCCACVYVVCVVYGVRDVCAVYYVSVYVVCGVGVV